MELLRSKKELLNEVKALRAQSQLDTAFSKLLEIAEPNDDFALQSSYSSMLKFFDAQLQKLAPLRVAILATSTVDHFIPVLKYWLAKEGFRAEFFNSEFNSITQTILDEKSELYLFKPDILWLFQNCRDFKISVHPGADLGAIEDSINSVLNETNALWAAFKKRSSALIIQNNADVPPERAFGNFEANVPWSKTSLFRRFNLELASIPKQGVQIFDLDYLASYFGKKNWAEWRFWYHSKHFFNLDAIGLVAFHGARTITVAKASAKKCLVLDLDNTLWGGVIGDDGVDGIQLGNDASGEAFVDFQKYILQLKSRGIILAVCSKNEEAAAKAPFQNHPDMQLKLDDISVFVANWNNKADNIRYIATSLNIGLDSIVFVDDNPAERELVRKFLPMVSVPELPEEPALYLTTLDQHAYFETHSYSQEDSQRASFYKDNAAREDFGRNFQNLEEFLAQLQMTSQHGTIGSSQIARAAQLINKSNQFNLTTIRYSESELRGILQKPEFCGLYFNLSDRFGDNGLISVVLLEQKGIELHIDTWVMSCRVLSRGMEQFIFNEILEQAKLRKCHKIVGCYIPTAKNNLVSKLYEKLGFLESSAENRSTMWEKTVTRETENFKVFINGTSEKLK